MTSGCDHVFSDSVYCVRCGTTLAQIKASGYDAAMGLLAQAQARIRELELERNLAVSTCWRIAGSPPGKVDVSMCDAAESRIRELEGEVARLRETNMALAARDEHNRDWFMRNRASVCTPEERAVLDAMAKVTSDRLRDMADGEYGMALSAVGVAELARRAAGKGG